ncbi:flippase activity-associated protein Agl23 [Pontiella agarivorans]|uniref:TIGR03663 family protein n=1 Tax=Pontiella agarivorans TaxID=3038953 RepID=A0ABU5MWQ9_9BACT|nr:flippase activity-associated protein Agl23 [Pontiella agarivorans]MDZ8118597.1 TIGR03663 family protein [Pontiella agarivorans]
MNKVFPIAMLLLVLAGLTLRIPHLSDRPLHHDEANQAYRFGILLEEGTYEYDADDHHGPSLYYLTLPVSWITGVETFADSTETTYRAVPVFFGILLILAIPLLRNGLGATAVCAAALFTAVSPGMAYYSRFYIQEILLVFFTFMAIAAGWRSIRIGSRFWAVVAGLSLGLMFATKETAIISYAAIFGAAVLCALLAHITHFPLKNIALGLIAAVFIAFLLFSSFFTNMEGPVDAVLAFKGYFARGTGVDTEHVHPWNFYLRMLTNYRFDGGPRWSEGLFFGLGLLGCISILRKKLPKEIDLGLARFIMFYTLLLTLAYSVISYKTPWCILSFLHGWILLAGIAVASILNCCADKITIPSAVRFVKTTILLLLAWPVYKTYRLAESTVFRYAADYRNPYVYAHTAPDFKNLVNRIGEIAKVSADGENIYVQVIASPDSTWPLPFYLRRFPNVGYWTDATEVPGGIQPALVIAGPDFESNPETFLTEFYSLRQDTLLSLHINRALWDAFLETRN